jgi:carbon-monoxide dehydrogenase medium subunit
VARRHRDLPIALAAAHLHADPDGIVTSAAVVLGGVGDRPLRALSVEEALVGVRATGTGMDSVLESVLDGVQPNDDVHATSEYRGHLVHELAGRALRDAVLGLTEVAA